MSAEDLPDQQWVRSGTRLSGQPRENVQLERERVPRMAARPRNTEPVDANPELEERDASPSPRTLRTSASGSSLERERSESDGWSKVGGSAVRVATPPPPHEQLRFPTQQKITRTQGNEHLLR